MSLKRSATGISACLRRQVQADALCPLHKQLFLHLCFALVACCRETLQALSCSYGSAYERLRPNQAQGWIRTKLRVHIS